MAHYSDTEPEEKRKFIQIAVSDGVPYGLDNHGDVWVKTVGSTEWEKLPPLPES